MMKKYLVHIIASMILFSCSTTSKFQVSKLGEEPAEYQERAVYVLPQTLLLVSVEFEKETFIPGPYRIYTERFLGLDEYISESGFSYRLLNVDVESITEPDPDQYYSINLLEGSFYWNDYLQLSRHGMILKPEAGFHLQLPKESEIESFELPFFTDRSVKRNLTMVTDTLYKTVISDSSYVRIPVLRSHREAKTMEQKAEEAANFIIKIRKRRFKLLAGQYELFPEGDALAISVEELNKLEKEYLELFLGKRIKERYRRSFILTPESNSDTQYHNFARFSPQSGLLDADYEAGRQMEMVIEPGPAPVYNLPSLGNLENNLIYRIPRMAEIRVRLVDEILYEGRLPVYQMGNFLNYPVSNK